MTVQVSQYKDAIGQVIKGGDIVISIRDGTGAKPRMAVKFTPSKVSVSGYGNNTSYMDACSLVVITPNVEALIAAGDTGMETCIDSLRATFGSSVEQPSTKAPTAQPLRWIVYSYAKVSDPQKIAYVSIHQTEGTTNKATSGPSAEAVALQHANDLTVVAALHVNGHYYYRFGTSNFWSGNCSPKESLHSRKAMIEFGIDGLSENTLLPVDYVNNLLVQKYRIPNV